MSSQPAEFLNSAADSTIGFYMIKDRDLHDTEHFEKCSWGLRNSFLCAQVY